MVGFIYKDGVIIQVEGDNELSVDILWLSGVQLSLELQHVLVVHPLEVILLGWLGDQSVDISKGILLITEAIVGWDLTISRVSVGVLVDGSNGEIDAVLLEVEVVGELVASGNEELSSVEFNSLSVLIFTKILSLYLDFVWLVVNGLEGLAGLVYGQFFGELLSLNKKGEGISAGVGSFNFSDFHGVISEVVVDDVGDLALAEELEDLSIVLQELLLRGDSSSSEFVLQEVLHHVIPVGDESGQGLLLEVVGGGFDGGSLGLAEVLVEFSGVDVTVVEEYALAVYVDLGADSEVVGSVELGVLSQNLKNYAEGRFVPFVSSRMGPEGFRSCFAWAR